jgi:hypothetical protein
MQLTGMPTASGQREVRARVRLLAERVTAQADQPKSHEFGYQTEAPTTSVETLSRRVRWRSARGIYPSILAGATTSTLKSTSGDLPFQTVCIHVSVQKRHPSATLPAHKRRSAPFQLTKLLKIV